MKFSQEERRQIADDTRTLAKAVRAYCADQAKGGESWAIVVPTRATRLVRRLCKLEEHINPEARGYGHARRDDFQGSVEVRAAFNQIRIAADEIATEFGIESRLTNLDWEENQEDQPAGRPLQQVREVAVDPVVKYLREVFQQGDSTPPLDPSLAESLESAALDLVSAHPPALNEPQLRILAALDGKALRKDALMNEAGLASLSGGKFYAYLNELVSAGSVVHVPRVGYLRPDAPPPEISCP